MQCDPNLVLAGFMGTGKSYIGRQLAMALKRRFVDTDRAIEEGDGRTIPEIFAASGESHFRALEHQLCQELSTPAGLIIATGGGMLLPAENQALMERGGVIICLWLPEDQLLQRLASNKDRPLLSGSNWRQIVRKLFAEREPAYRRLPYHVNVSTEDTEAVLGQILTIWRNALPLWRRQFCRNAAPGI